MSGTLSIVCRELELQAPAELLRHIVGKGGEFCKSQEASLGFSKHINREPTLEHPDTGRSGPCLSLLSKTDLTIQIDVSMYNIGTSQIHADLASELKQGLSRLEHVKLDDCLKACF